VAPIFLSNRGWPLGGGGHESGEAISSESAGSGSAHAGLLQMGLVIGTTFVE
jgi:hypothetical protein